MIKLKRKKIIFSMLISICCTFFVAVVFADIFRVNDVVYAFDDYSFFQERNSDFIYSDEDRENILNIVSNKDYLVKDGHVFIAQKDDPQIIYDMQAKKINAVRLYFGEQLKDPIHIQAFYTKNEGEDFSEDQSVEATAVNTNMIELTFPAQSISMLRLDIGDFKDTQFIINKIEISYNRIDYTSFNHMLILEAVFMIAFIGCNKLLDSYKSENMIKNRRLIWNLSKNDFKTKYAGSLFGVIWAFVQPIVTVLLYWFVFQVGLRSGEVGNVPFVLWLLCGLVPWFFFQDALLAITNSMIEYSYLVKKMVFQIDILPIVKVISALFVHIFFIAFTILMFCLMGYYPTLSAIQIIYYLFCSVVFVLGLGYATCALVLFFKDLNEIIQIFLQIGMWMTPILWNVEMLPKQFMWMMEWNPMYYIVSGYRDSLITHVWVWNKLELTVNFWLLTIALFVLGKYIYKILKCHFADVL